MSATYFSCLFSNLPRLRKLEMYHNKLTEVPSESLHGLRDLTHLDLGRNRLEWSMVGAIRMCDSM